MRGANSIQQVNRKHVGKHSQYQGVTWSKQKGRWLVHHSVEYKTVYVGLYDDELEAAREYIRAIIKVWGPHVRMDDQIALGLAGNPGLVL